jgi:beta-lactamase class A
MRRRTLVTLIPSTLAASAVAGAAPVDGGGLDAALQRFAALPGTTSYLIHAGQGAAADRIAHQPDLRLFVGSAFKTFVLAQYLRDVEAGLLSEDEQLPIDDDVRNLGSPVFLNLAGRTPARSVLEAMIAHSDNTATDAAMRKVGADRVRALVAEAGLRATQIPDSTRIFFSYTLGAPEGVDLGWAGIQQAVAGSPPGPLRPPLNDRETLASSASDLVAWYERALRGAFFAKPETLTEFKRIQAMADAIARTVPPGTAAYAKGGSIDFDGFNCLCVAGQMVVGGRTPVTFCLTVNWDGPSSRFAEVENQFVQAVAGILRVVQQRLE